MYRHKLALFLLLVVLVTAPFSTLAWSASAQPTQSACVSDWRISQGHALGPGLPEAYTSALSVKRGQKLNIFINSSDPKVRLELFRVDGSPASLQTFSLTTDGVKQTGCAVEVDGIVQATPPPDSITHRVECDWVRPSTLEVPATMPGGSYFFRLTGSPSGKQAYRRFVVKDEKASDILLVSGFITDEAYNGYPYGYSLYPDRRVDVPAVEVSFDRPLEPDSNALTSPGAGTFFLWEFWMSAFVERSGYSVSYCADTDVHEHPEILLNHKAVVFAGHQEYWTWEMRFALVAALQQGLSAFAAGSNLCYWQARLAPGSKGDISRTIICYKAMVEHDPVENPLRRTTLWRLTKDDETAPPGKYDEARLFGSHYLGQYQGTSNLQFVVTPENAWLFEGTALGDHSSVFALVGYEADTFEGIEGGPERGHSPPGTIVVSQSQIVTAPPGIYSHAVMYSASGGGLVFTSGTMQWNWGLARGSIYWSAGIEQVTHNVLARMLKAKADTAISAGTVADSHPIRVGDTFQLRATVTSHDAVVSGEVEFLNVTTNVFQVVNLIDGVANLTLSFPKKGTYPFMVVFKGNSLFKSSQASAAIKVRKRLSQN